MTGPQGEGAEMRGTQSRGGPKVDLGTARGRGGGRLVGHAQAVVFPLSVKGNHVELGTEGGQKSPLVSGKSIVKEGKAQRKLAAC